MTQGEPWHTWDGSSVLRRLGASREAGLSEAEATRRLRQRGRNRLPRRPPTPGWRRFLGQFGDFMVLVLIGAAAVSAAMGEQGDAVAILAIVLMNALLGYVQESRAERALEALASLTAPTAKVVRQGRPRVVPAEELVPGDLVLLEAGDRVPADLRLVEVSQLQVEEAVLTGESLPVAKTVDPLGDAGLAAADQRNMAFMATTVRRGRGMGVVVATGLSTQMGRIAELLHQTRPEPTPLERRLAHLSRVLVGAVLAVCAAVVALGVWRGENPYAMFLTGVSLGVAAIPEGLPAIVTVALALGVQRMARRNAIVRRLPAVETLGCATVIGTDNAGSAVYPP